MGCWYHAKKIQVSDFEADELDDEGGYDGEDEGVSVEYMVSDHEEGDQILIDMHGNDQMAPHIALSVADAIQLVNAWSHTEEGKTEIERLRARHYEKAKAKKRASTDTKSAAPKGRP